MQNAKPASELVLPKHSKATRKKNKCSNKNSANPNRKKKKAKKNKKTKKVETKLPPVAFDK